MPNYKSTKVAFDLLIDEEKIVKAAEEAAIEAVRNMMTGSIRDAFRNRLTTMTFESEAAEMLNSEEFLESVAAKVAERVVRSKYFMDRIAKAAGSNLTTAVKSTAKKESETLMMKLKPAAEKYGVSYDRLRKWCITGEIAHVRTGRDFLINTRSLEDLLNNGGEINDK